MGSHATLSLPVIDFLNPDLNPGTPEWESVKSQVWKATEEYGCFEAKFKEIPCELETAVFGSLNELFDLPLETKMLQASEDYFSGYLAQLSHMPLNEVMGIDDASSLDKVESFTHVFWPEGNKNFSKIMLSYTTQVSKLENTIRSMIVERLGVDKYLDEQINSIKYVLRGLKYRAPETTQHKVALSPHIDKNVMTILHQYGINGLQVQSKDGEWMDVKFGPNSFVVIVGESLYAWTNGLVQAPRHRVAMAGNETRYSIGLFTLFKPGYMVRAPEELVDQEHPRQYKPFDFYEFLKLRWGEKKHTSPIKDYFGA